MEQQCDFTVSDLASKCRSKTEFYNVLTREGGLYLPPIKDSTQRFIRSLMRGEKEYVKCSSIKVIQVQYKGLTVRDIIKFAKTKIDINSYLPDYEYLKETNREWLCNVVNSLIPNEFQKYIKICEEKRREELLQSSNLAIRVKPEFLDIFKSSQSVSTIKGKSHFLTRNPKITKDKISISILNEEKKELERRSDAFQNEVKQLKNKLSRLEEIEKENEDNLDKLSKLYDAGIINEEGYYINNRME